MAAISHTRLPSSTGNSRYVQRTETGQTWSQRNQRDDGFFTDQHGREYYATIETKTGAPCSPLELLIDGERQHRPPLTVPSQFIRRSSDRRKPTELEILYDAWLEENAQARAQWLKDGRQVSRKLYGEKYVEGEEFTSDVLDVIGDAPPSAEPIKASQQGNPWVLGLTDVIDRRLVQYFPATLAERGIGRASTRGPDYSVLDAINDDELEREFNERAERKLSQSPDAVRKRAERAKARAGATTTTED